MTTLATERLILRRPLPRDWPAFRDFMLSERAAAFGSHGHEGRAFRAFAAEIGHWEIKGFGMFTVTCRGGGDAVALVGPWAPPDFPEGEIGWMVLEPSLEGKGVAREAAEAALRYAFGTLGWATAVSYVGEGNKRSAALAERLGAVLDPDAAVPAWPPGTPGGRTLVYRHPRPEGLA